MPLRLLRFVGLFLLSSALLGAQSTYVPGPNRWAVIVGVDQYVNTQIAPLKGAVNDAKGIAAALETYADFPHDHIILLTTDQAEKPTKTAIFKALQKIRDRERPSRDDLLTFFFAGHGVERYGSRFLLAYDTNVDSEADLKSSSLPAQQLMNEIETMNVRHRLVMIDACRNDPFESSTGKLNVLSESMESALTMRSASEAGVRATFLSTTSGQSAFEWPGRGRGLFSYFIEQGLSGGAALIRDVTLSSLTEYLNENLPQAAREIGEEQIPFTSLNGVPFTLVRAERLGSRPATPVVPQPAPRIIYGQVKSADDAPLRNATVTLALAGSSPARPAPTGTFQATTDESGFFRAEVPSGDAPVDVGAVLPGYVENRVTATREKGGARSIFLGRADKIAPANPDASTAAMRADELANVASLSFLAEEFVEAEESAREALAVDPDHARANAVLGNALAFAASKDILGKRTTEGQAKLSEARDYIDHALREDPNLALGHNARGLAYLVDGDLVHARSELQRAIALDSRLAVAYANLGEVLLRLKRYNDAEKAFRNALKINPRSAIAYNGLAEALTKKGKYKDAVKQARNAIAQYESRDENLALFYVNLAKALENQHQDAQALEAVARAKSLGMTNDDIARFRR
jgi:tetratricopeptide (TPR) repeat protein